MHASLSLYKRILVYTVPAMTAQEPLATARAYHHAWTAKDFDRATALLADDLAVEVPVNDYPTTASFAAALQTFGSMTRSVELLSAMSAGDEAMLLYDMDVEGLGVLRVAEHFTLRNGKIARLRQIHDTTTLRAAGFAGAYHAV
jgi:ketosteroid isomerase-like protein